jgi:hypothetical protein
MSDGKRMDLEKLHADFADEHVDSFVAARLGITGGVWRVALANLDGDAGTGQQNTLRDAIAEAFAEYKARRAKRRPDLARG